MVGILRRWHLAAVPPLGNLREQHGTVQPRRFERAQPCLPLGVLARLPPLSYDGVGVGSLLVDLADPVRAAR
jgi:hypothetical protein